MARSPNDARYKSEEAAPAITAAPSHIEAPLFRFGLRQIFWVTALLSVLLACVVTADGITASVILLASLVVVAHVFGTSLGSRLREHSDKHHQWRGIKTSLIVSNPAGTRLSTDLLAVRDAARSPWHGRGSTPLPWLRRLIVAGALAGGAAGAIMLLLLVGHRASVSGILLGSASLAVLGGWFSFLGGSFYGIFRHGLRDALHDGGSNTSVRATD